MGSVCGGDDALDDVMYAPPPSAPSSQHDLVFWGIVLCELAVTLIALGANIQRYGLTQASPAKIRWLLGCRCMAALALLVVPFKSLPA